MNVAAINIMEAFCDAMQKISKDNDKVMMNCWRGTCWRISMPMDILSAYIASAHKTSFLTRRNSMQKEVPMNSLCLCCYRGGLIGEKYISFIPTSICWACMARHIRESISLPRIFWLVQEILGNDIAHLVIWPMLNFFAGNLNWVSIII